MLKNFLSVLYPPCCPICGEIVIPKDIHICNGCRKQLPYVEEPRCKKCSKPVDTEEQEYCFECSRRQYHFDYGYALWFYNEGMRHSISEFKYKHKKEYTDFYVEELLKGFGAWIVRISPDALVPVPLHKSKARFRGYNQAELLANGLGAALKIPIIANLLQRSRITLPQKQLGKSARQSNLEGAFSCSCSSLEMHSFPKCVLLIDDIYTTGSTVNACAKVLKLNGAKEVFFLSLCIGSN